LIATFAISSPFFTLKTDVEGKMNHTVSLDDMQMRDAHLCMIKEQIELLSSGAQETRRAAWRRTVTGHEEWIVGGTRNPHPLICRSPQVA
jgi:hypothetical protein